MEAQLLKTLLLNRISLATMVGEAAGITLASGRGERTGQRPVDFWPRRE